MSTRISKLATCSEGLIWKDFILVPSIETATIKMDAWNKSQFFSYS